MYNEIDQALNREPKTFLRNLSVFLVILVALSWGSSSLQFAGFTEAGLNVAKGVIRGLFSPNWALILNLTENGIPYLILQTIAIAILGTIIGAILAIPFSFLASTAIVPKPIAYTFRAVILGFGLDSRYRSWSFLWSCHTSGLFHWYDFQNVYHRY